MKDNADEDPLIQSAVRALALWLREDDNELLRKEATGLTDMFLDLYRSHETHKLDFRSPVLVAFEALMDLRKGRAIFSEQGGWSTLFKDLDIILRDGSTSNEADAARGIEIVRILMAFLENADTSNTTDEQMDLITTAAAMNIDNHNQSRIFKEFDVAVLMLSCSILSGAAPAIRRSYVHSIHAIRGIATQLQSMVAADEGLREDVAGVLTTLTEATPQ
jgi:hypothetical protein